jgi:hypothetical protein
MKKAIPATTAVYDAMVVGYKADSGNGDRLK